MTPSDPTPERIEDIPAVLTARIRGPYRADILRNGNAQARAETEDHLHRIFRLRDHTCALHLDGYVLHLEKRRGDILHNQRLPSPIHIAVEPGARVLITAQGFSLQHGDGLFYTGFHFAQELEGHYRGSTARIRYEEHGSQHTFALSPHTWVSLIRYVAEDAPALPPRPSPPALPPPPKPKGYLQGVLDRFRDR